MFSQKLIYEIEEFKKIKSSIDGINVSYENIGKKEILKILNSEPDLEKLALKSKKLTEHFFGKTILLYTPLYISDFCINGCLYCGFSALNKIKRNRLSEKEIEKEMIAIKGKGFNTILILTGEDKANSNLNYILKAIRIARKYFSEILIEVYPLEEREYKILIDNGVNGVTLYQKTYDKSLYKKIHQFGPKKNFEYRLEAIERAIKAGIKEVNIGPLLGLNPNFDFDVYMTLVHADYLQKKYSNIEISISYPRIRASVSKIKTYPVTDKDFVKIIFLTRLFIPNAAINLSTRESSFIRDNLIGLGVTKISAESKTTVGGYINKTGCLKQFETDDTRTVKDIIKLITKKGYRAEFTNWVRL